ncbi:MAG: hypothetical protein PHR51_00165 [Patescibacteria group bacterium]|nr:hypothetical protein [Patescibacteria group bacterium]
MENTIGEAVVNQVAGQAQQAAETATAGFMQRIFDAYNGFIGIFPEAYQWVVSIILVLAVAAFLWSLVKKNWLWIVLVIVLFPGILPVLKNVFDSLTVMFTGQSNT